MPFGIFSSSVDLAHDSVVSSDARLHKNMLHFLARSAVYQTNVKSQGFIYRALFQHSLH